MTRQEALDELQKLLLTVSAKTAERTQDIIMRTTNDGYRAISGYLEELAQKGQIDKSDLPLCVEERQPYILLHLDELQQIVDLLKEVDS